jgi:hypothetical protein
MSRTCFFISRIGDPGSPERDFSDKLLKYIVAPVLEKCGYETPVRADQITQPGVITTQVFTHLWTADLVVADLTGAIRTCFMNWRCSNLDLAMPTVRLSLQQPGRLRAER